MIDRRKLIQIINKKGIIFGLRDEFTTAQSAPLAGTRNCEPGPGTLTISDSGNKLSISGGKLISNGTTALANPIISTPSRLSRVNGNSFLWDFTTTGGTTATNALALGFRDVVGNPLLNSVLLNSMNIVDNSVTTLLGESGFSNSTNYKICLSLRSSGAFYLIKGGIFTNWTLLWASRNNSAALIYAILAGQVSSVFVYNFEKFLQFQMSGDWSTDYGIATSYTASPTNGITSTMSANGIINFTWTPVAAETLDIQVRRTDDNNTWIIRSSQSGSTIKIFEKVLGVETERSTAANTFTAGTPVTIQVKTNGTEIRTFVNSSVRNAYSSAAFNQTQTGLKVSGFTSGSNLASFPRELSANAISQLDKYAGG